MMENKIMYPNINSLFDNQSTGLFGTLDKLPEMPSRIGQVTADLRALLNRASHNQANSPENAQQAGVNSELELDSESTPHADQRTGMNP